MDDNKIKEMICAYNAGTRKHVAWYFKGMPNAAKMRKEAGELETFDDLIELCKKIDV